MHHELSFLLAIQVHCNGHPHHRVYMNCFNHPHSSAHGICKVCGRGLCFDCAAEIGYNLACKDLHEQQAATMQALTQRSETILKTSRKARFFGPVVAFLFGGVILVEGLRYTDRANSLTYMGALFILVGLAILLVNVRAYGAKAGGKDGASR